MGPDIVARGAGVESSILAAGRAALAERLGRYGTSVRGVCLFAEDVGKETERAKQVTARVDLDSGGRLVLQSRGGTWEEILRALPGLVDDSVHRELQRRWELIAA